MQLVPCSWWWFRCGQRQTRWHPRIGAGGSSGLKVLHGSPTFAHWLPSNSLQIPGMGNANVLRVDPVHVEISFLRLDFVLQGFHFTRRFQKCNARISTTRKLFILRLTICFVFWNWFYLCFDISLKLIGEGVKCKSHGNCPLRGVRRGYPLFQLCTFFC